MNEQVAPRTPGARRAGKGEFFFELAKVDPIKGGPDYSSVFGPCIEGERMMVALMRMPAGTGAEPHFHPNEQWIFVLEGTAEAVVGGRHKRVTPGLAVYIPANTVHQMRATPDADVLFFTCKDAAYGLHGMRAAAE
ncbi:MAG: cupin domain-containing protein [Rhodospirillales bacterium]|nr:cupin domain-containing protein [Rhodospirillales bacterium]